MLYEEETQERCRGRRPPQGATHLHLHTFRDILSPPLLSTLP
jgi:hypothetical protein